MSAWSMAIASLSVVLSAGAFLLGWRRGPSTWSLTRRVLQLEMRLAEVDRALEAAVASLQRATRRTNLVGSQPEGVAAASAARSAQKVSPTLPSASRSSKSPVNAVLEQLTRRAD